MEDSHKHFSETVEGRDEAVIGEKRNEAEDDKEELADEEVEQHMQNLKKKKARGCRRNFKRGVKVLQGKLIVRRVWEGEGVPRNWGKAIIAPIKKKRRC